MKKIKLSPTFINKLTNIKKKDKKLFNKINKQLNLFKNNPKHPSLRIHKLKGKLKNTKSLSITMNIRLLFIDNQEYYFFDLGTHNQIYK